MKVFLGGTCNGSDWRDRLIPYLHLDYFNPVVDNWNEEAKKNELKQREECDFILYTITPKMKGFYSIAEAVDDSNKRASKTIFCVFLNDDELFFDDKQINSLREIGRMIERNGGKYLLAHRSVEYLADALNFLCL